MAEKHPLIVRLTHWVNFPVLFIMMWSGVLIYWANDVYWPHLPPEFYDSLDLSFRLAEGMAYHFFFMWIFAINSLIYFSYIVYTGYWRVLSPAYNPVQRLAYKIIIVLGLLAVLSGFAIYKPVQLYPLKNALGGYSFARVIHYLVAVGFFLFFFVHVTQVIRAGWNNFASMVGNKVGFAVLVLFFVTGAIAWNGLHHSKQDNGIQVLLRRTLEFNEKIGLRLQSRDRIDHVNVEIPKGKKPRVNGTLGIESALEGWQLSVITPQSAASPEPKILNLSLDQIKSLEKKEIRGDFRCIEGWAEFMSFGGATFRDFLVKYKLGTHSGETPDWDKRPDDLYKFVGLETPDGQYYVSIDMKSMLNPNTLLAYEQNGDPLANENGAPLRLYIPNKYGVKNLKRIGKIRFSDTPLRDYWGESGYDWFIGL